MQPSNNLTTDFFNLIKDSTPYLALYKTSPNAADTSGTEVTGGSYARKAITFGTPNLTAGEMKSTNTINFAGLPTTTIKFYGIRTAATGGELKAFGPVSDIAALSGDEVTVAVGNITVTFGSA